MQVKMKVGHVEIEHDDQFKGEVVIRRGTQAMSVPIDALKAVVAESIRFELANHISKMKPADLLRRIA